MALRASYYGLKKRILDKVLGDYDTAGIMTNKQLTDFTKKVVDIPGESATFKVPLVRKNAGRYTSGIIIFSGGVYHFAIKLPVDSNEVIINKIFDAISGRSLSGVYADGVLTLTFSSTIYGGVLVEMDNV